MRKSSGSEVQSGVDRYQTSIVETQPEIAIGEGGQPLLAKEIVVLISLPKRGTNKESNVVIRGIGASSLALRPQVKLLEGRMPKPGSSEIVAGRSIAVRFKGGGIGEMLRFGTRDWRVVGIFDAGNTGFSSEIWGDGDQFMQAFRRPVYSSILFRMRDPSQFEVLKKRMESDPRLTVEAKRETLLCRAIGDDGQILRILGMSLTIIFPWAIIGAMITMYAAVSTRTSEIGTLRALGFQRSSILLAFLIESLFLGWIGGCFGLFFASFLQVITISTMNFQTFSELAFSFTLTFDIIYKALAFALGMGLVGGVSSHPGFTHEYR
jgi:ABC-type lipoprotein release transport system permease subunit